MGVDTFSIYEGFYEHSFLDDKASFLFGLVDYNSEFYVLDYGLILMHSSFGYGIDVSQAANSTYPLTGLTGRLRVEPTDDSYFMFSMSDAVPGDPDNYHGTHVQLRTSDGIFYAAEYGLTSTEEDSITNYYKVALGGWYRTTDFEDYAGNQRSNTGGVYLIGEKQLTHEADPTQGLGAFAQIGFAEPNKNLIGQYFGAGLHYTGLIPGRDSDITALGVAHARHGNSYMNSIPGSLRAETAIEFSYSAPIGYGIRLQPDIQYIVNPGTDSSIDNALVIGSRIEVVF